MTQVDDLSRSLAAFDQNTSLVLVVEMSEASWLVAGLVPGVDRQPLKKLEPDPSALLRLLERWQAEAMKAGQTIGRVTLAYEGLVEDTRENHPQGPDSTLVSPAATLGQLRSSLVLLAGHEGKRMGGSFLLDPTRRQRRGDDRRVARRALGLHRHRRRHPRPVTEPAVVRAGHQRRPSRRCWDANRVQHLPKRYNRCGGKMAGRGVIGIRSCL